MDHLRNCLDVRVKLQGRDCYMWRGWKGQVVNILKGRAMWEMSKPSLTFIFFLHLSFLCCFTFFPSVYRKINKDHLTSSLSEYTGKDVGYRNGRWINYSFLERHKNPRMFGIAHIWRMNRTLVGHENHLIASSLRAHTLSFLWALH